MLSNIILFGPPGAGKSTQCELLIKTYGFTHICPGNIFRSEVLKKTELGKKVKMYIDRGLLTPNDLVVDVVKKKMKSITTTKGFLFDGYPRTQLQASMLDRQLKNLYKSFSSLVIVLNVNQEEVKDRIKQRGKILHRADDQSKNSIIRRIQSYREVTLPVLNYYRKQKKIVQIVDGGNIDQVAINIKHTINMYLSLK